MRILIFLLFSLYIESSELNLQSQDKVAGDVLSSSQWNEIIKKIQSSDKLIGEEMLIGNWLCFSETLSAYPGIPEWTLIQKGGFNTYSRSNFPLTFQASTVNERGTWSSTETKFFSQNDNVLSGTYFLETNMISIHGDGATKFYLLRFHGESRFSAVNLTIGNDALISFYCDKQS